MIAPGGEYTFYGIEARSFDPAIYLWFFQGGSFGVFIMMGVLNGIFVAIVPFVISVVLAAALSFVQPLAGVARLFLGIKNRWLFALLALACLLGLLHTIHAGVNPGICC